MRFFDRFRNATRRYAAGVHDLGDPAAERALDEAERSLGPLPADYREFLTQWNGCWLFHDDYALYGVAGARADLARLGSAEDDAALLHFGTGPDRQLLLDGRGRVLARDLDTDDVTVEGSDFAHWLDALLAREGVLYDRDGEFREEAFDRGDLSRTAALKRAQVALKLDPDSPAWHEEMARLLIDGGEPESAAAELVRAVELAPQFAGAWLLLARVRREAGDAAGAIDALLRAAEAERDPAEAAFALASAARLAADSDAVAARELGRRAAGRMPSFVAEQRAAAAHLAGAGDLDAAAERLALAAAVAPDSAEVRAEQHHLRARRALRPI